MAGLTINALTDDRLGHVLIGLFATFYAAFWWWAERRVITAYDALIALTIKTLVDQEPSYVAGIVPADILAAARAKGGQP